jgi:hypothetical protein
MFFWWNRLLGAVIGWILRQALWRSQHVWISFGTVVKLASITVEPAAEKVNMPRSSTESIQFSPLAGRILFKNLRYHSSNMSFRVLKGHITWRAWKWKVRSEGPLDNSEQSRGVLRRVDGVST